MRVEGAQLADERTQLIGRDLVHLNTVNARASEDAGSPGISFHEQLFLDTAALNDRQLFHELLETAVKGKVMVEFSEKEGAFRTRRSERTSAVAPGTQARTRMATTRRNGRKAAKSGFSAYGCDASGVRLRCLRRAERRKRLRRAVVRLLVLESQSAMAQ